MADTDPRIWNRSDIKALARKMWPPYAQSGHDAPEMRHILHLCRMMEFVETFAAAEHRPAQARDEHGRFAKQRPNLEAVP